MGEPETQLLPLKAGENGAVQDVNDKGLEFIITVGGVDTFIGPCCVDNALVQPLISVTNKVTKKLHFNM